MNDTFENDTVGSAPKNWNMGTSVVYRYFTEQMSTTVVTFALKVTNVGANFAGVEVYVDDDNFNG